MSKKLSFRGSITPGTDEQRIKLATLNGKRGYKITKFQIMGQKPGRESYEYLCQIYSRKTSPTADVEFTNSDLMAVAYLEGNNSSQYVDNQEIIFDNEIVNQDIYVTGVDASGGVVPLNYYLELETVSLSDTQATQLTLKNLRRLASR
jgi:hypothetical protein|tara:strand:- start:40 stop:483 length:444 start_codon:yes stop_codon:yes gene_type:complete